MDSAYLAAAGAALSGLGSVLAALGSLKIHRKQQEDICEKRIRELTKAYREGMKIQKRIDVHEGDDHEERWSGLP